MLKALQTVRQAIYSPFVDAHGATVDGWGEPVEVRVYGWSPLDEDADVELGRSPVTHRVTLLIPAGVVCGNADRWWLAGVEYRQVGGFKDYTTGPFGYKPGGTAVLERIEG